MQMTDSREIPEVLFHYCSNESFCSVINSGTIWLSSLSLSNDSMEGKWLKSLFKGACEQAGIAGRDIGAILESFDLLLEICDGLAFCLSEAEDMLSQWRGYAANGEGVCIGFRSEFLSQGQAAVEERSGYKLTKINYGRVAEENSLDKVVSSLKASSDQGYISFPGIFSAPEDDAGWEKWWRQSLSAKLSVILLVSELFAVKNPAFREEREWRLLSLDFRLPEMSVLFRARGHSLIPYRVYPMDLTMNPVSQVILGPKNQSKEKDVERFLKSKGFPDVEVSRSAASYR